MLYRLRHAPIMASIAASEHPEMQRITPEIRPSAVSLRRKKQIISVLERPLVFYPFSPKMRPHFPGPSSASEGF